MVLWVPKTALSQCLSRKVEAKDAQEAKKPGQWGQKVELVKRSKGKNEVVDGYVGINKRGRGHGNDGRGEF